MISNLPRFWKSGNGTSPGNRDSRQPKLARALRALGQEYQREMLTKQRLGVNQFSRGIDSLVPRDTKGTTRGSVKMKGYVSGEKCNNLPRHAVIGLQVGSSNYPGLYSDSPRCPEVRFEDIVSNLLEPRFRPTSDRPRVDRLGKH